jgi:predicted nuclease of predicted toxin-antitoxin system
MRFLIDESADARIAAHLRSLGHDATTVAADHRPGLPDDEVLRIAQSEGRILITDDSDFGELVFRRRQPHAGVIYFRLSTTVLSVRTQRLTAVLTEHESDLDQFLVVTEGSIRIAQPERQLESEQ